MLWDSRHSLYLSETAKQEAVGLFAAKHVGNTGQMRRKVDSLFGFSRYRKADRKKS
jgi:hypothetical protein